jgi:hypothetical protein
MDLSKDNILTTEMIVEYADCNPKLAYTELSRKIVKEGGLYQYSNFNSLRRNVEKKLKRLKRRRLSRPPKRLFFDIETSPNIGIFWRAGWKQTISPESIIKERAIICICWKWEGDNIVNYLTWDKKQDDGEMLKQFSKVLLEADEIIAHNGDRFDIKWFNTRCLYHNINILPKYKTLDTLKKVKSHFYFNSNKLDYIAQYLEVGGKIETGGLDLWKNIILNQCDASMEKMVEYCQNDVVILEDVYHRIKAYITQNTHHGVHKGGHKWDCPTCTSVNVKLIKNDTTAKGTLQRWMECGDCNSSYKISNKVYMGYVENKIKNNN